MVAGRPKIEHFSPAWESALHVFMAPATAQDTGSGIPGIRSGVLGGGFAQPGKLRGLDVGEWSGPVAATAVTTCGSVEAQWGGLAPLLVWAPAA